MIFINTHGEPIHLIRDFLVIHPAFGKITTSFVMWQEKQQESRNV